MEERTNFLYNEISEDKDPNAPGLWAMWKYNVKLSTEARNIVLAKFNSLLLQLTQKENIKLEFFKSVEDLNRTCFPEEHDKSKEAGGVYSYVVNKFTKEPIYSDKYPLISLTEDYDIFTLAHEIGHHFAYKFYKDRSESAANRCIQALAELFLTNLERYIISISLMVHSGVNAPLPVITRKEWREYVRIHRINVSNREL